MHPLHHDHLNHQVAICKSHMEVESSNSEPKLAQSVTHFPSLSLPSCYNASAQKICNPDVSTWMYLGRAAAIKEAKDAERLFRVAE